MQKEKKRKKADTQKKRKRKERLKDRCRKRKERLKDMQENFDRQMQKEKKKYCKTDLFKEKGLMTKVKASCSI